MRQFARPFPIDRLSLEARVLYTAFLLFLVAGIASSVWLYRDSFGSLGGDAAARYYLGDVGFELMESTTPDGDVAKFIEKRGEGIMLLSFNVDSTSEAVGELEEKGYPFIGGLRPFRNCQFAFVHPKATNGVLLEYIDDKDPPKKAGG